MSVSAASSIEQLLINDRPGAAGLNRLPVAPRPPLPPSAATPSTVPPTAAAARTVPPAAAAARQATGVRAGSGLAGKIGGLSGGAAVSIGVGAVSAPSNFARGYAEGHQATNRLPEPLRRVSGAISGVNEALSGALPQAAIADFIVDDLFNKASLYRPLRSPMPETEGHRSGYAVEGDPAFEGGQCSGIYFAQLTTQFFYSGGFSSAPQQTTAQFPGPWSGPKIETITSSRGRKVTSVIYTHSGGPNTFAPSGGNDSIDAEVISFKLTPVGFKDNCGNQQGEIGRTQPGAPTTPYRPPLDQPLTQPGAPARATPSPTPQLPDPYTGSRPEDKGFGLPAVALGAGVLGAGALGLRNLGKTAAQSATDGGAGGKTPQATKKDSKCPCSKPLLESLQGPQGAQAATTGALLAKLATMQKFAETAWKATRLDKVVQLLTLISVIHNAGMLSRSVGETLGELTSNMLATLGIKDETGNAINVNEIIGTSTSNLIKSIVGEEIYNNTSKAWQKANRILSAASQIVYTVRSINDAKTEILEWTAENTGKIGNALKRWGVVGEKSYPWMAERVRAQDAHRRRFERITEGLESIEDAANSLSQVTGNVREIQEEYTEFQEQRKAFRDSISIEPAADIPTAAPENIPIAEEALQTSADSQSADVAITDAQRGQNENPTTFSG